MNHLLAMLLASARLGRSLCTPRVAMRLAPRALSSKAEPRVLVISMTGPDGDGTLEKASDTILQAGGSVRDSRSTTLNSVGVMMLEVSTSADAESLSAKLRDTLPDFHVAAFETTDETQKAPKFAGKFMVTGADKVGMLKQIVAYIASQNLAIKTLVSNVQEAAHTKPLGSGGRPCNNSSFEIKGILEASSKRRCGDPVDVDVLRQGFTKLESELGVTITFDETADPQQIVQG